MAKKIKTWWDTFSDIFKEAGFYSVNRVLPGILFFTTNFIYWGIIVVLFVLSMMGKAQNLPWLGEVTTAYLTIQTLVAGWLTGNKFTNSKYNTEIGAPGKPMTAEQNAIRNNRQTTTEKVEQTVTEVVTNIADRANGRR